MPKMKIRPKHILVGTIILIVDVLVYLSLGVLLMVYDDNWDSSKGEYWSLASMNFTEKVIYISFNAWGILNIIAALFIGLKIYKNKKHNDESSYCRR